MTELDSSASCAISFKKFWERVQAKELGNSPVEHSLQQFLLLKLQEHPMWWEELPIDKIDSFSPLFQVVQNVLLPFLEEREDLYWGLATPVFPTVFFATEPLNKLLGSLPEFCIRSSVSLKGKASLSEYYFIFLYSYLFQKFLDSTIKVDNGLVITFKEGGTGLVKYFRLEFDLRFVDVQLKGPLPALDLEELERQLYSGTLTNHIKELIPLCLFDFKGFSIIKAVDETAKYVVEDIRDFLFNQKPDLSIATTAQQIFTLMQSLYGSKEVRFGLMPLLELNGRLVDFQQEHPLSLLANLVRGEAAGTFDMVDFLESYRQKPHVLFARAEEDAADTHPDLASIFKNEEIGTIALVPIFREAQFVGVLEVVANRGHELNYTSFNSLGYVLPWLAELVQAGSREFAIQISLMVKQEFTNVQPAIEWRLKEAAWKYMNALIYNQGKATMEPIIFNAVYPLYGAIDIRNSTAERNIALRADWTASLTMLMEILTTLKDQIGLQILDEKIAVVNQWLQDLSTFFSSSKEVSIQAFLEKEIIPLLRFYREHHPKAEQLIDRYLRQMESGEEPAFQNRKNLEESMHLINVSLSQKVKLFHDRLQACYPCYFESFRTDGVEYDVFLGQSISPSNPFHTVYLSEFRLLQLLFMAETTRFTHSLLPNMKVALQTTQLIYVNDQPIDISFRNDEKRFDVEGAYNVRYQLVKKRIDKVRIKGTGERLTQPGKIAIVYSDAEVALEYAKYLTYLQKRHYLTGEAEYHELEELQGVSGLKAIRVEVHLGE